MKNDKLFEYAAVVSSNIKAMGYNPNIDILSVVFKSGDEYWYFGVSALAWADLFEAESKGKHLNEHIKGKYRYLKVTPFEHDPLIDAIDLSRIFNISLGEPVPSLEQTCEKHGLDLETTWEKIRGRTEWYQYQPSEYKDLVRVKLQELAGE